MDKNIESLICKTEMLRAINQEIAIMEHGIREEMDWHPYAPTHFIYSFFEFNTLYNIDWWESIKNGRVENHPSMSLTEFQKQRQYVSFCFSKRHKKPFYVAYWNFFKQYTTIKHSEEEIGRQIEMMYGEFEFGGAKNKKNKWDFINACKEALATQSGFTKENAITICEGLYAIRCNIFHGAKSVWDMNTEEQKIRLSIYASLMIAFNQMIFAYMDYEEGYDCFREKGELFLNKLRERYSDKMIGSI